MCLLTEKKQKNKCIKCVKVRGFLSHHVSIYANCVRCLRAFVPISVSLSVTLCCCSATCECCFVMALLPCPIIISYSVLGKDLINCPMSLSIIDQYHTHTHADSFLPLSLAPSLSYFTSLKKMKIVTLYSWS